MNIELKLPNPPSLNSIWRQGRKRVYRSKRYTSWIKRADVAVLMQKSQRKISGPYVLEVSIKGLRKNADIDNCGKVINDYLQRIELIENDKLCQKMILVRDSRPYDPFDNNTTVRVIEA